MNYTDRKFCKIISLSLFLFLLAGGVIMLGGCFGSCSESGSSGHGEGEGFEFYAGPVFPLTFMEPQDAVRATRSIDYNFSAYDEDYGSGAAVTDSYLLHNASQSDVTVTAVYPYVGSFNIQELPAVTLDDGDVRYEIHGGEYAGGFTGGGGDSVSLNLQDFRSWDEYAELLDDGSYFTNAFASPQNLDQPVVVYKLYDIVNKGENTGSAVLSMQLDYDSSKTELFTFGFNGGGVQEETGIEYRCFFIREWMNLPDYKVKYLIALGEDIHGYTLQGYRDGSCTPGEELQWPDAKVERYETTLGEALRECARVRYDAIAGNEEHGNALDRHINEAISFDQYYEQVVRHFMKYGPSGTDPKERYGAWGSAFDSFIGETGTIKRILYLTFDVTIPAGETAALKIEQWKSPSGDYYCSNKADEGLNGYDLVTSLGSNISYDRQAATISGYSSIEIVRQNYGFDLGNGITETELDLNEPRYYLEIRKVLS